MAYGVSEAKATRIGGTEKIYPLSTVSLVLFNRMAKAADSVFYCLFLRLWMEAFL